MHHTFNCTIIGMLRIMSKQFFFVLDWSIEYLHVQVKKLGPLTRQLGLISLSTELTFIHSFLALQI